MNRKEKVDMNEGLEKWNKLRAELSLEREAVRYIIDLAEKPVEAGRALRACSGLSLPSNVPVGALREVVEALRALADACYEEFDGEVMEDSEESEPVMWGEENSSPITFGHIRRALRVLSQLSEPTPVVEDKGPEIELPFSVIMDKCRDWDAFCNDVGLSPWCMKEGLASGNDTYSAPLSTFQKHGII